MTGQITSGSTRIMKSSGPAQLATAGAVAIDLGRGDCMKQPSESRPVKRCKRCEADTERYKDGSCAPCVRARARAWSRAHPDRNRERARVWRAENPERSAAKGRSWREANLARERENGRRWREQNAERKREADRRHYEANAERIKAQAAAWYAANTDRAKVYSDRRRARKRDALVHDVPDAMVWEFNPAGPGCCNYCRKPLEFDDRKSWHIDHVVPLSRGGLHEIGNLVVACAHCNLSKHTKLVSEWRAA